MNATSKKSRLLQYNAYKLIYRSGDGNGSVDAEAVPGMTDVAEVTAAGNGTAATEPLLAPSAKATAAVHPSDNIRPFTMAALNSVTISSGRGNKRGEDVEGCDGDGARVLFYNLTATISGKLSLLLRVILFR